MGNQNYRRGANFERSILNKLRSLGYDGMRSAGSHSCADLFVWIPIDIIVEDKYPYDDQSWTEESLQLFMIQCKHSIKSDANFNALFNEENVIKLAAMPDNFTKVLCIKQPRSNAIIQLVYDSSNWKIKKIFDI